MYKYKTQPSLYPKVSPSSSSVRFIRTTLYLSIFSKYRIRSKIMRRNCNLELRLVPFPMADLNSDPYPIRPHHSSMKMEEYSNRMSPTDVMSSSGLGTPKQNQPLTIFYNGKICVCDVTEFQARAIILLAGREMEDRMKTPTAAAAEPCSPSVQSPIYSPTAALSMKRSLQRFLQKRKHRAQATSPYHH